ncbi:hypothetical protein D3H55_02450 [Bacillus salacetis]|uniref:YndJ family transporter n=1 Tax=Bacillus salacetis TaxID=2315464 RepID=A0A3A1R7G5_9BACI|nr:YndJ family protein [Bacillus salacetis]RIW38417.1 hypothetical protein D3H55_02450 [Bacillus salacetis]
MDRNLAAGMVTVLVFLIFSPKDSVILVEGLLLFAVGVLIPLSFPLIDGTDRRGKLGRLQSFIHKVYFLAPIFVLLAMMLDIASLYIVWCVFALGLGAAAAKRILERGVNIIEETAIDTAYLYLSLGSIWLLAYGMQVEVMGFSGIIVLLTAIHFHYSAFSIPLFAGLLKRKSATRQKLHNLVLLITIVSPMTIALGITYWNVLEFAAVSIYMASIILYGYLIFTSEWRTLAGRILISLSAGILLVTIVFSIIYSFGSVSGNNTLSITEMIFLHGIANALGVSLLGLIGWNIENPQTKFRHFGKPFSSIRGGRTIGIDFLHNNGLESETEFKGLTDCMSDYRSSHFDPDKLSPVIQDFYVNTNAFELKAVISWEKWFYPLALVYEKLSKKTGQIHLGKGGREEAMVGDIIGVDSEVDGREKVRAWRRINEAGEPVFLALYSRHCYKGEAYMNIALPLPLSTMTGILKPENKGNDLILTSSLRRSKQGDEGIYLTIWKLTLKLPLAERFHLKEESNHILTAYHQMWLLGMTFLKITYSIKQDDKKRQGQKLFSN